MLPGRTLPKRFISSGLKFRKALPRKKSMSNSMSSSKGERFGLVSKGLGVVAGAKANRSDRLENLSMR
jgi:hypothetical protein